MERIGLRVRVTSKRERGTHLFLVASQENVDRSLGACVNSQTKGHGGFSITDCLHIKIGCFSR